jgi:hypothetical protein
MELFLNLAGLLVAVAMFCLWLRWAPREGLDRQTQLVALAVLILLLFPVISVTDDLMAVQNPAETDSSLRLDHLVSGVRPVSPVAAGLPAELVAEQPFFCLRLVAPGAFEAPQVDSPAMAPIESRPPPIA